VQKSIALVAPNVAPWRLAIPRNIFTVDDTRPILWPILCFMLQVIVSDVVGCLALARCIDVYIFIGPF
jgi:hypothetical protein